MKSLLALTLSLLLALVLASSLHAQVGNQNPSGVAGIFNGEAGGRPVDPYTGNATTSITDISVAGAVGEYPLALVRTANSRSIAYNYPFGLPGAWNHNYNWLIGDSPATTTQNFHPTRYTAAFPDGRVETFRAVNWSPVENYYRVRPGPDTPAQTTSSGVRERFVPLNLSTMLAKLILPDGGQVEFSATQHSFQQNGYTYFYYKYRATGIIDPYGLRTNFTYDGQGRLSTVAQPQQTSRSLQFYYRPNNSLTIDHVTEVVNGVNRRTVQYNYSNISPGGTNYLALTSVGYYGQSQWTASYKYRAPNVAPANGIPLLWTCNEPTYAGPMKRIVYEYKTGTNADNSAAVHGQILRERYWDGVSAHEASGAIVSTLTVGSANPVNHNTRTETRGDGATRTFVYNSQGYITWASDFMGHQSSQTYDTKNYVNAVTNFNRITTNYTNDPITGNVTQIQYPATPSDTLPQSNQGSTVNYTYTNGYYLHTSQDEAGHTTTLTRDGNNRVTQISYPDGGYETFSYAGNSFGLVTSHRMTTGGTETFSYDTRGLKQTYRDATNIGYNPSLRYQYDGYDRITDITDAFGGALGDPVHTTSFTYDLRGQVLVTTFPNDPNVRHTITNVYNADGTLQSKTDQLGHMTSYTYDDYRRVTSVTPPARGGTHTTSYAYYDPWANRDNYADTNAQASFVLLPSGKATWTVYDDNWRKRWTTVGWNSGDDATTVYEYDAVGNVTKITAPNQQAGQQYAGKSTQMSYDERNRPFQVTDALNNTTSTFYDTVGRKKQVARPNSQWITYDSFDNMNRVLQQTVVANWPSSMQVTKYTYYQSGLLHTMQDPHLVELNNGSQYTYEYDTMGRQKKLTYPPDSGNVQRTEQYTYDAMGRLQTFINRDGKTQTFTYDALNRLSYFTWTDGTPRVDFGYDAASRLITINNVNANITKAYYNDNLLWGETEAVTGGTSRTMSYGYDEDGNRASIVYPDGATFDYTYTGRNQLHEILSDSFPVASYGYNVNGDMTGRGFRGGASSTYAFDALDRVTHITHSFNRDTRTFDYDYDSVGNRKWTKRDGANGDVFRYDLAGQVTAVKLNIANPDTTPTPPPTIVYDANGNRTSFAAYGPNDSYTVNNLNQYASRNGTNAAYDNNGNLTAGVDGSAYAYDAQNRLVSASKGATTDTFAYDGLNRQVSRTVNGGTPTYNVWDGWDLVSEYHISGGTPTEDARYLYGPSGLVKNLLTGNCYFQDGSGNTSHLSSGIGDLREWYRYDLQGTPFFYDANNNQRNPNQSAYGVRHLFTGQQWYSDIGLYDLRNRFYSPDIGRFLQPDPIGFNGDPTNLYRYCGNNPVMYGDPSGEYVKYNQNGGYWYYIVNPGYPTGISIGAHGWCAEGAQILAGGYWRGTYHDVPNTDYWRQGAPVTSATERGIVIARGWVNGRYAGASMSPAEYSLAYPNLLMYHTGIFIAAFNGEAFILEQSAGQVLDIHSYSMGRIQEEGWREVTVPGSNSPYAAGTSADPNARGGSEGPTLSKNQRAKVNGLLRLASRFNSYWGYLPTTNTMNWAGGLAGPNVISTWDTDSTNSPTLSNFGNITIGMGMPIMEPGIGPGSCFVAGTPVLMADGSEKPIENIQVGEGILAWNEETKQVFPTKVVSALHHEEKMETLFDIELEDGRKFTVNNDHPMYVVEDADFKFTDELAARFSKGEPVTFQDNKNQPVKIATLQMRRQMCKMYNLHVEGQGKNGHTYYANGILVHNAGAGYRFK